MAYYSDALASLNAAISAIESGKVQETSLSDGRRVTYLQLPSLYAERRRLEPLAVRESRGGGVRVAYGVPL